MEISGFPEGVRVSKGGCTCKPGGCTGIGSLYLSLLKPDPLSTLLFSNIPPDITYSAEIQTFLYNQELNYTTCSRHPLIFR